MSSTFKPAVWKFRFNNGVVSWSDDPVECASIQRELDADESVQGFYDDAALKQARQEGMRDAKVYSGMVDNYSRDVMVSDLRLQLAAANKKAERYLELLSLLGTELFSEGFMLAASYKHKPAPSQDELIARAKQAVGRAVATVTREQEKAP